MGATMWPESDFWTIYRQLFSLVFLSNLAIFIFVLIHDRSIVRVADAAAANFLACGLARQPLIVNSFFITLCSIPKSLPLWLRRIAANIYHYGGVHSGCGIASLLWYVGLVALMTRNFCLAATHSVASIISLILCYLILVLLLTIIGVAYPAFRVRYHNAFELTHRYLTWAVVALFLTLLIVFARARSPQTQGDFLLHLPAFWCVCISALAIIQPWTRLRAIPIRAESLSSHALRLHLPGTTHFGKVITLSRHPLRDWHSFATFPDPPSSSTSPSPSFSVVVSRAGDWTADLLAHPPIKLYTRGTKTYGFTRVMRLFHRIILVATGSGIGPCLAFLEDARRPAIRLIWQTRAPLKTYGAEVLALVHRLDPSPVIVDTDKCGRVDMVPLVHDLEREVRSEMVCVISNQRETERVVWCLCREGIAAVGPLFDS
ncbi:uncharacterized protein BO97DRAFT_473872 [Aspergillus homomorphus CBS 101889]|uniref:Integral membrane protein TmpA n=1 Tax=Aspergillus homomorphus (strain CBS 101889) TaxID=1450537 RepID=A0A395HHC8_ASPHC|nr:hypothetical protein BO97DRAFT_473872 [Aspergillus homomorphus CBS 101889]RAL07160.1 hypothetical protein BO97DRAFT_473872 [Aspergillus homomorphus CBS 101889]